MSTPEQKVEVITKFLHNRANLKRVTSYQEVQRVAGEQLYMNRVRWTARPIGREQVATALAEIAKTDLPLVSIVVHFWDDEPGHQFTQFAADAGHTFDSRADLLVFHKAQVEAAFAANENYSPVPDTPETLVTENSAAEGNTAES